MEKVCLRVKFVYGVSTGKKRVSGIPTYKHVTEIREIELDDDGSDFEIPLSQYFSKEMSGNIENLTHVGKPIVLSRIKKSANLYINDYYQQYLQAKESKEYFMIVDNLKPVLCDLIVQKDVFRKLTKESIIKLCALCNSIRFVEPHVLIMKLTIYQDTLNK